MLIILEALVILFQDAGPFVRYNFVTSPWLQLKDTMLLNGCQLTSCNVPGLDNSSPCCAPLWETPDSQDPVDKHQRLEIP